MIRVSTPFAYVAGTTSSFVLPSLPNMLDSVGRCIFNPNGFLQIERDPHYQPVTPAAPRIVQVTAEAAAAAASGGSSGAVGSGKIPKYHANCSC